MTLEAPAPACPEPGGPELTCPDCGSRDLYRDLEAGELVCPRCGLVVAARSGGCTILTLARYGAVSYQWGTSAAVAH